MTSDLVTRLRVALDGSPPPCEACGAATVESVYTDGNDGRQMFRYQCSACSYCLGSSMRLTTSSPPPWCAALLAEAANALDEAQEFRRRANGIIAALLAGERPEGIEARIGDVWEATEAAVDPAESERTLDLLSEVCWALDGGDDDPDHGDAGPPPTYPASEVLARIDALVGNRLDGFDVRAAAKAERADTVDDCDSPDPGPVTTEVGDYDWDVIGPDPPPELIPLIESALAASEERGKLSTEEYVRMVAPSVIEPITTEAGGDDAE